MPNEYEIYWNEVALRELLSGPDGDIARWLIRVGTRVESAAKLNASGRPGPNVQTGRLRSSITYEVGRDGVGLYVDIGSNVEYACVFGGKTFVQTREGKIGIMHVRPGMEVLTQTGEYHPVHAVTAFPAVDKPDLVTLEVFWRKGHKRRELTLTEDHKVLAYRDGRNQWVEAGMLTTSDFLYSPKKRAHNKLEPRHRLCRSCGGWFLIRPNCGKFYCSMQCRNAAYATELNPHIGMRRSEDTKQRLSDLAIKRGSGKRMNMALASHRPTQPQNQIETWLVERGVKFEKQASFNRALVDFWCPDTQTVYEADGGYWHQDQKKDIERDKRILEAAPSGTTIIHVHFHDKRHSPELVQNPLPGSFYVSCNPGPKSFVDPTHFQGKQVLSVKHWRYQKGRHPKASREALLYDLAVDDVHSFLANGVIVSNSYVELGTVNMPAYPYLRPSLPAASGIF